jgi:hypothetical protein
MRRERGESSWGVTWARPAGSVWAGHVTAAFYWLGEPRAVWVCLPREIVPSSPSRF